MCDELSGRCECGRVAFTVRNARATVSVCHCRQCRRLSGHLWASTHAAASDVTFSAEDGLAWYTSSSVAKRGFCRHCGSSLFHRKNGEAGIGIASGCLDTPTGLRIGKHIFAGSKGDYYDIGEDAPHYE